MRLVCISPTKTLTKNVFYDVIPLISIVEQGKTKLTQDGATHRTAEFFKVVNDTCMFKIYKANRFK